MLFSVSICPKRTFSERNIAIGKAPADVSKTLAELGYTNISLDWDRFSFGVLNRLYRLWQCHKIAYGIGKNDTVIVQSISPLVMKMLGRCRKRGARIIYLVHDLNYVRYKRESIELKACQQMDELIVHTESMRQLLVSEGITVPIKVMHLFDYYSDDAMPGINDIATLRNTIAFAGNISKSTFLFDEQVFTTLTEHYNFDVYGYLDNPEQLKSSGIRYKGDFPSNKTGQLKAGWGLVWDGDSTESCQGNMGEYLRINSPHKISLYLCSGFPVIVWSESCIGQWLVNQGVAIAIKSIKELHDTLSNISEEEYLKLVANAQILGQKLRTGSMLKSVLLH